MYRSASASSAAGAPSPAARTTDHKVLGNPAPHRLASAPAPVSPTAPAAISMPAYRGTIAPAELDDLVVYVLAISDAPRRIPPEIEAGRRLAARLGCFGCHGPDGRGGPPNPG